MEATPRQHRCRHCGAEGDDPGAQALVRSPCPFCGFYEAELVGLETPEAPRPAPGGAVPEPRKRRKSGTYRISIAP